MTLRLIGELDEAGRQVQGSKDCRVHPHAEGDALLDKDVGVRHSPTPSGTTSGLSKPPTSLWTSLPLVQGPDTGCR